MFEFLEAIAIVVLFAMLVNTRNRLKKSEEIVHEAARRIGALQRHAGFSSSEPMPEPIARQAVEPEATPRPTPETLRARPKPKAPLKAPLEVTQAEIKPAKTGPDLELGSTPPKTSVPINEPTNTAPNTQENQNLKPSPNMAARFEDLFGKKLPIWAGGITLAIAGVMIVKYAVDAGFFARVFSHGTQVVCGVIFGLGLIAGAEWAWRQRDKVRDIRVPQALSGAGIATLYASVLVAGNVYELISPLMAFIGLAAITASALGLSLRFGAPSALLGLAGGLAAPALVGAVEPNVPLLAVYLGLTVAGLVGVSRMQRWPWLALGALVGGAGWSLWMVFASSALDVMGSLSVGGLVLLLALALPMLAPNGPRSAMLRSASAVVGSVQLAILLAIGGFSPLHWGLFGLLALAGQWLAWRDKSFAAVPSIGLPLSVLLLAIWPDPTPVWFAGVGLFLAAIYAIPLLMRLWQEPVIRARAMEISGLCLAIPILVKWQFWDVSDGNLAIIATGSAVITVIGAAIGWRNEIRLKDDRFTTLSATTAVLLALAISLIVPIWMIPLGIAIVTAGLLFLGRISGDLRIEWNTAIFAGASLAAFVITGAPFFEEFYRLRNGLDTGLGEVASYQSLIRWGGMTMLFIGIVIHSQNTQIRRGGQIIAAILAYGFFAQFVSSQWLMVIPAIAASIALFSAKKIPWSAVQFAAATFIAISLSWALIPLAYWGGEAVGSLAGIPMLLDDQAFGLIRLAKLLIAPAILIGGALWSVRSALPRKVVEIGLGATAMIGGVAVHWLYRITFAQIFGADFTDIGIAQRLVWEVLLIGGGWLAMRAKKRPLAIAMVAAGTMHAIFYTLILHNPLWAQQSVGALPLANVLIPVFAVVPIGLSILHHWMVEHPKWQKHSAWTERSLQIITMVMVSGFAWASLRHGFHGALLTETGVLPTENIARSILLLLLAIGFLLWGIRTDRHDWRIASLVLMLGAAGKVFLLDASGLEGLLRIGSFVALGFSLIGIGWLYSRQLSSIDGEGQSNAASNNDDG